MPRPAAADRRQFLSALAGSAGMAVLAATSVQGAETQEQAPPVVRPAEGKRLWLSCKLSMIPKELQGKKLSIVERLRMAAEAGFDGVDFDQAGEFTPEEARAAVEESRVFVHNAINHAHWNDRLTSADEKVRAKGRANIEHCIRVSHAAGGSGVLIVIGGGGDGTPEEVAARAKAEIEKMLPLAAALGQPILFENVWNKMFYDHNAPPEQSPQQFIEFIDSFQSPWVGMYYDIGNHWKYGQPGDWIRAFGRRCVKLDVKGFSRKEDKFTDVGVDDLPWDQVRKALADIQFTGWATAEVGGGDVARLTTVRKQMEQAFGLV